MCECVISLPALSALTSLTALTSCVMGFFFFLGAFLGPQVGKSLTALLVPNTSDCLPRRHVFTAAAAAAIFLRLALACVHRSTAQSQPASPRCKVCVCESLQALCAECKVNVCGLGTLDTRLEKESHLGCCGAPGPVLSHGEPNQQ